MMFFHPTRVSIPLAAGLGMARVSPVCDSTRRTSAARTLGADKVAPLSQ